MKNRMKIGRLDTVLARVFSRWNGTKSANKKEIAIITGYLDVKISEQIIRKNRRQSLHYF
jgi:hypothetical protein